MLETKYSKETRTERQKQTHLLIMSLRKVVSVITIQRIKTPKVSKAAKLFERIFRIQGKQIC